MQQWRRSTRPLEDAACVIRGDLTVYGSPWTPFYRNWAFNLPRGPAILQKWKQIPDDTDILITHGPPLGRGDLAVDSDWFDRYRHAGCLDLLHEVQRRVQPRVHIFGHIHEGRGATYDGQTLFVNASNMNEDFKPVNQCFVVDVPHDRSQPAVVITPTCCVQNTELRDWFLERDFLTLASYVDKVQDVERLPSGDALLYDNAFGIICHAMYLHRCRGTQMQLRDALAQMYAESFNR